MMVSYGMSRGGGSLPVPFVAPTPREEARAQYNAPGRCRTPSKLYCSRTAACMCCVCVFTYLIVVVPALLCFVEQMERYKEGPRGKPPHVFAVGHRAYYDMLSERKPQVSLCSRRTRKCVFLVLELYIIRILRNRRRFSRRQFGLCESAAQFMYLDPISCAPMVLSHWAIRERSMGPIDGTAQPCVLMQS